MLTSEAQYSFIPNSKRIQILDSLDTKIKTLCTEESSFKRDTSLFYTIDRYNYHFFEFNRAFAEQKLKKGVIPNLLYKIAKHNHWQKGIAIALIKKADAIAYLGDKASAVELYKEVIKISENNKFHHEHSSALIKLAICFAYRKNTTKADWEKTVEYMNEALRIAQKSKDIENIHQYYNFMGDFQIIRKQYQKALVFYETEYPILQNHKNLLGYRTNLAYLGICYLHSNQEEKALVFLNRFFEISSLNEGSYASYLHYTVLNQISNYYLNIKKDYKKALKFQLQYAQNISELPLFNVISHYEAMAKIYEGLNNFPKAFQYQKRYSIAIDSLKLTETAKKFSEIEDQLTIEKKENQIKTLQNNTLEQKNISQKSNIIFLIIIFIFIFGLLGSLLYTEYLKVKKNESELQFAHERNQTKIQIIQAQETERQRIAQDLHDEVGNSLAALKNYLSQKYQNQELGSKINQIAQEVRNISHNLASIDFETHTLSAAFKNLISRQNEEESIEYELIEVGSPKKIPSEKELFIYRIACELLNNIRKHSQAKKATIQLIYEPKTLTLIVEDDGIGIKSTPFDTKKVGIGLSHLQTRVAFLNGKLSIEDDGKGTIFIIEIPV